MPAQSTRRTSISRIVKTILASRGEKQKSLAPILDCDESTVTRKMKNGHWTIDDLDAMAAHFDRPITVFFSNPDDIYGGGDPDQRATRCMHITPEQGSLFDGYPEPLSGPTVRELLAEVEKDTPVAA